MVPSVGATTVPDEKPGVVALAVVVAYALSPLTPETTVLGQYEGYHDVTGVSADSATETFVAVRLALNSWRWEGVPWYLRSGKRMTSAATEVLVQLKPPPQRLFDDSDPVNGRANYIRFRLSDNSAVALAARVKQTGKEFIGEQRELLLLDAHPGAETPYERMLGEAMAGNGALFTRQDAVEAAWAAIDPVLSTYPPVEIYQPGSWGPAGADALIAADGGWHDPST